MQGKELLHCGKVEEQGLFLAKRSVTNQVIKCSITNSQLNRVFFFWGGGWFLNWEIIVFTFLEFFP